ncbi:MAG: ABC transporter permease [Prevotellaceae bacterium]|jgi:ABC-type lipoprotein release transport system permease subunit|nr:ABC transporter permease [Prevotellaceae bacterium]
MTNYLGKPSKLSWRNIWRNRRRSLITMASVFFAVFFCVIMTSYSTGMWDKMIENTLRTQAGHVQIHGKGYWDDKIIDNFLSLDSKSLARLSGLDNIENVSPRVETFAMASYGTVSKGIALIGVSPAQEAAKSNLPVRLAQGEYLTETDNGVLIGEGLSRYLKAGVGDTLALIGQGYHGTSAAGLFPVRGILKLSIDEMNSGMAYLTLAAAQQFIDMPDGYSGILVSIKDNTLLNKTIREVQQTVDTAMLDVYPWKFTMERLLQTAESDKAFNYVVLLILYVIAGFGILGTVIMLTGERRREFAVMISLGMPRRRLASVVALELLIMTLCGVAAALLITVPVAYFFALNPIEISGDMAKMYTDMGMEPVMPMSTTPSIFITQIVIVTAITALTAIYPIRKIFTMKIVGRE